MRRDNNFGAVHIAAAFMVMAGHMYALMGREAPVFLFDSLHGNGRDIILVMSGYLVTLSWEKDRSCPRYLAKRFFRIIPPLAACVIFCACVIGPAFTYLPLGDYFRHVQFRDYFRNIVLDIRYSLPGVFADNIYPNAVNGSLWTLPIEAAMYAVTPAVCVAGKKLGGKIHLLIAASACAASLFLVMRFPEWRFVVYGTNLPQALYVVPFYLLGSLAAAWRIRKEFWSVRVAIILILALQALQETGAADAFAGFTFCYLARYLVIAYAVFAFAFGTKPVESKGFLKLQELSYGAYLYGFPIQQVIVCLSVTYGLAFAFPEALALSAAGAAGMAYLSHVLVEEPSRKACGKLLRRMDGRMGDMGESMEGGRHGEGI